MLYNSAATIGGCATINGVGSSNATGIVVQSAIQRIAVKFFADLTTSITGMDIYLNIAGTTTGITIQAHIETDSGNAPSGTTVGAATSSFACPSASGTTGLQTFGTSASLTAGVGYWLVLTDGGGTAPTASNSYQLRGSLFGNVTWSGGVLRQFNGTNWTTTGGVLEDGIFVLEDSLGGFHGQMVTATTGLSARTAVFGTNYLGIVMQFAVPTKIYGLRASTRILGTPVGGLEMILTQDGGPAIATSPTIPVGGFQNNTFVMFIFNGGTPIQVPANTNIYFLLHQAGSVGASGNSYTVNVALPNSTYISALENSNMREVQGTLASNNADPSGLTRFTNEIPEMAVMIQNPATDFVGSTGSTGFFIQ